MTGPSEVVADRDDRYAPAPADRPVPADQPGPRAVPEAAERSALMNQMGGVRGLVDSGLPALIFVTVNVLAGLQPAVVSAVV